MGDAGGTGIVGVVALAPAKLICIYWGGGESCCIHCIAGESIGGGGAILLPTYTLHGNDN